MIEFIDKTSSRAGTFVNRANLMAMQGFIDKTVTFNEEGSITETNGKGEVLTITFSEGTITETFVGEKTIVRTISIDDEGNITEVIS